MAAPRRAPELWLSRNLFAARIKPHEPEAAPRQGARRSRRGSRGRPTRSARARRRLRGLELAYSIPPSWPARTGFPPYVSTAERATGLSNPIAPSIASLKKQEFPAITRSLPERAIGPTGRPARLRDPVARQTRRRVPQASRSRRVRWLGAGAVFNGRKGHRSAKPAGSPGPVGEARQQAAETGLFGGRPEA